MTPAENASGLTRAADFSRDAPRFFFERANGEPRRRLAIAEVINREALQTARAFTLCDVDELMQKQLAISPVIRSDHDSESNRDAA